MLAVALAVAMLCGVCLNLSRESSHASSIVVPNLNTTAATAVYQTKRAGHMYAALYYLRFRPLRRPVAPAAAAPPFRRGCA